METMRDVRVTTEVRRGRRWRVYDASKPRLRHTKPAQQTLAELKPGEQYVHDHTRYETDFPVWLAQQRMRLNEERKRQGLKQDRNFVAKKHDRTDGWYIIWIPRVRR